MFDILQGFTGDRLICLDRKPKTANPVAVIKSGACVTLDENNEVVIVGGDATVDNLVFWAWTSANDPEEIRSDYYAIGKITIVSGVFIAETDQYDEMSSYAVGAQLTAKNGILLPAEPGEYVKAWAIAHPASGRIKFITLPKPLQV